MPSKLALSILSLPPPPPQAAANGSISSSLTSTSHTLTLPPPSGTTVNMTPRSATTNGTVTAPTGFAFPASFATSGSSTMGDRLALLDALRAQPSRHVFLQPPSFLPSESLRLVKDTLEGFAASVSDMQLEKLRAGNKTRRKRKWTSSDGGPAEKDKDRVEVLKIRRVHVDGFETGQVWQQAKRIINSALDFSARAIEELEESNAVREAGDGEEDEEEEDDEEDEDDKDDEDENMENEAVARRMLEFGEDGFEVGSEGWQDEEDEEDSRPPTGLGLVNGEKSDGEGDGENGASQEGYVRDPHGLNDGFFSIDDFNRITQWFEEQDARGDPNTDRGSDNEDEIDWHADPLSVPNPTRTKSAKSAKDQAKPDKRRDGKKQRPVEYADDDDIPVVDHPDEVEQQQHMDSDDEEEDGPTFGNMDLYAPEGASEDELDNDIGAGPEEEPELNANGIFYRDFFAPAKRREEAQAGRKKSVQFAPDERDVERAMADVRHDLYDDLSEREGEDSAGELSDVSAGDPKSRWSNHDRRQAKIGEEIRRLESELVAKRAWTMSGEAAAPERPVNSALDEDLDFEHVGKPVPVITAEVTESIEAMIKRRIVAREFDEVIRRRPDAAAGAGGSATRRGLVSVDDAQSTRGLADIFEEEHVKATNPDTYVSAADEKLQQEEAEVERMWRDVCGKLDALSSWHYRPRQAEAAVTVVPDVAVVSMEDAQPATAQGVTAAAESTLAPQEVYRPGEGGGQKTANGAADGPDGAGVVHLAKSGLPVARAEMSRTDKMRRRRREKERLRKAGPAEDTKQKRTTKGEAKANATGGESSKSATLAQLKRGGVAVINKRGELVGVDGKKAKAPRGASAEGYKL